MAGLFVAFQRVTDEPYRGGPEADKQSPALRVAPFFLIHSFATDPESDAKHHGCEREEV